MIPIAKPYLGEEEILAVEKVLRSGIIAQGPKVRELEEKFAKFCGTKYAVAMNSGTAALHTSLNVAGIKKGDEVLTTPFTFIATGNTILMQNAIPKFVDINEDDFNINTKEINDHITDKTKGIVSVDLYGQLCDYNAIDEIKNKHDLIVIEDACQAVSAEFGDKLAGSFGDLGCFSFYATKNITSGEGGMITTDNKDFYDNAKLFRQHGRSKMTNYDYSGVGYNYRTTDINAVILLEQLKKVDEITDKRIKNASLLTSGLKNIKGIITPVIKKGNKHAFHQYTIRITDEFKVSREELIESLNKNFINTGVYYPKPLHLHEHFEKFGYKKGDFPVAEKLSGEVLSLPVHPHLSEEEIELIISSIAGMSK